MLIGVVKLKYVLLFSDPGIDDALAIIYALLHPQIEIVGIVTGYGNVSAEQATDNAAYILQLAGRSDIPVIDGAQGPFSGELVTFYPEIHGPEGLGPIRPPENIPGNHKPFQEIFSIIKRYKNHLTIVDVGRSTSLAIAFLLDGEQSMKSVREIYVMGGAFNFPGNVTAVAEANFHGDPVASDLVLENGSNITILPLNVTNFSIVTTEIIDRITQQQTNPFSFLIKPIFDYYFNAYKKLIPGINGAPLHDVLTLFAVIAPEQFEYLLRRVRVEFSLLSRGRTVADFRAKPTEEPKETLDRIVIGFNYQAFIQDFIRTLTTKFPVSN
ncbi:nucleoside hydrolase [Fictibacillus sp. NRS-1165]|uniref:nucleoside hydrolase n=1 Tax=Fictibacillus sp. NRS-1165 TaxID=3144463 RepID=UPI003D1E8FD8